MTTALEVLGVAALAGAAWFVWEIPGVLAVIGVFCLLAAWVRS